jgi:hypothetical protein
MTKKSKKSSKRKPAASKPKIPLPLEIPEPFPLPIRINLKTVYIVPSIETHKRVVELFDAFKYDITNVNHWLWLLQNFSDRYFERRRGRPTKWNETTRAQLLFDLYMLGKFQGKVAGDTKGQAKLLKEHHKLDPFYKNLSETEIYKNLLEANSEDEERWRVYSAAILKEMGF